MTNENTKDFNISVAKAQASFMVRFAELPEASQDFIIAYGLKQLLNDSVASLKIGNEGIPDSAALEELATDTVNGKIALLESGEIKTRNSGGAAMSPLEAEIIRQAKAMLRNAVKAAGKKLEKEQLEAVLPAFMQKHGEKIESAARAELKRKAEIKAQAPSFDLDDLI